MESQSWEQIRNEFLAGVEAHPDLFAHWDAKQQLWTLRSRRSADQTPDLKAQRLFVDTARAAVSRLGRSVDQRPAWHIWLDLMRESKRGFHRIKLATSFGVFRNAAEGKASPSGSGTRLLDDGTIHDLFAQSAEFCADLELQSETQKPSDPRGEPSGEDRPSSTVSAERSQDSRMDTRKSDKSESDRSIEDEAREILRLADAEANSRIATAVRANEGVVPGTSDLGITGERRTDEVALKMRQAGNAAATKHLYDFYAERNMNRAHSADGFLATLDAVIQRVVDTLGERTDLEAAKELKKQWSDIARQRDSEKWFVRRARQNLGPAIQAAGFWNDLEARFRELSKTLGDTLKANWTSSAWGEDGEQWYLSGAERPERDAFARLAERGAVGLGHPSGHGALFFWLDELKNKGLNFNAEYQGTDTDGNVSQGGKIRRPSKASADYCFTLATINLSSTPIDTIDSPSSKLNIDLIDKWMKEEGYSNQDLADILKVSVRTVSSLRNDGEYHGEDAVTKLANLMNRDVEDLYLQ